MKLHTDPVTLFVVGAAIWFGVSSFLAGSLLGVLLFGFVGVAALTRRHATAGGF